ncbi:MAG: diacylglycerol kinase family lipid kinase [Bacteroidales bacterium]|nr:diacylglycerol kinase family lipid kinase [Bacteroidales bacterium]
MLFIVNPISGKGRKKSIIARLRKSGYKVVCTEYAGHAEKLAREAAEQIVVAVGGDGTVNEVARGLVGTGKTLGIIPCGSGDGLARHLGISHVFNNAMKTITSGKTSPLDAGTINGRLFFSVCGVGFDAVVSERFAKCGKRGLSTYIKEGLKTWRIYLPEKYKINIDGQDIEHEAIFITVGNSNQWGNGAKITPLADSSDGILDMTIVDGFRAIELPWLAGRLMTGSAHKSRRVHTYRGRNIIIDRSSEGPAHADGDWFEAGQRLKINVIPHALDVLVP